MTALVKRPDVWHFAPPHKAKTVVLARTPKGEARRAAENAFERVLPATRGDCLQGEDAQRPCPYASCRWHLYLDVSPRTGALKLNYPQLEVWDLPETCALDVADRGETTLEAVGVLMNMTRERIRQIEAVGLAKLKALSEMAALVDL